MKFYSTRRTAPHVDFKTALFQGIAPDGGLYMPEKIPPLLPEEVAKIASLQESGFTVLRKWISTEEIPDEDLRTIIEKSLTFPIPLMEVGDYGILELFHGPTLAFKDIAAGVLAHLCEYYLAKENKTMTILVATSGDTGGAIAQAFSGLERVQVVILYPIGKVSELQKEQLTRVEDNVLSLAVEGVFDDCQSFVKSAFQDPELQQMHLSSANSINIGRLIPQIIYYVWAYKQAQKYPLQFIIPSGNMGNATAALFASLMGIPLPSLIVATNENDSVVEYYTSGRYQSKKTVQTLSTAMDIGKPNNFERILELFHSNHEAFRKKITAIKITDKETIATIQKVYEQQKYLLDFHTAVGYYAAEKAAHFQGKTIVVSTASPLKFAKEIEEQTGIRIDNSSLLAALRKKKKRFIHTGNTYEEIKALLLQNYKL